MSDLVKEKPIMEEVQKRYNNFIKDRLMMNEYDKREAYLYGNQIMLEEERRLGIKEGIEQGEKNKAMSMAKNMKTRDMDLNLISELTGLSIIKKKVEKYYLVKKRLLKYDFLIMLSEYILWHF